MHYSACRYAGHGGREGGPPTRRPTSRRPARRLLSPLRLIFITRIWLVVFFCFRTPKACDAHNEIRIIRLYEVTNVIDFYNEATVLSQKLANRFYLFNTMEFEVPLPIILYYLKTTSTNNRIKYFYMENNKELKTNTNKNKLFFRKIILIYLSNPNSINYNDT